MNIVSVIGYFGENGICSGGQSVKTTSIVTALKNQYGADNISCFETTGKPRDVLKAPLYAFAALRQSKNVLILPAKHGLKIYAPLLVTLNIFFKRKLHYIVIGGWLPEYLKKHRYLVKYLKRFNGIYVETTTMKKALEAQGFTNVIVMPNFKDIKVLQPEELVYQIEKPFSLCTFSRVVREKGIEDAINAVEAINTERNETVYTLDIYGQVDQAYSERFDALQAEFPDYIRYKGVVPADESVDVIQNYYALLFPTYYAGEGFAGTLLDAFAAGVPVVASDWRYNAEIITDGKTGAIFEAKNIEKLKRKLVDIQKDSKQWNALKQNCLQKADKYRPENVMKILLSNLG